LEATRRDLPPAKDELADDRFSKYHESVCGFPPWRIFMHNQGDEAMQRDTTTPSRRALLTSALPAIAAAGLAVGAGADTMAIATAKAAEPDPRGDR
jgi:hypothetical protein